MAFVILLAVYAATLAPGLTFWDAGELISAVHTLGIPHPPGTPLFVALGHAWSLALGGVLGVARSLNLLSAVCTAAAAGLCAWLVTREAKADGAWWGALTGALCAGLMSSAWANATETELYAFALLHVVLMLAAAAKLRGVDGAATGWVLLLAYLIALAPAVHLSSLVGAPAAIVLAARRREGGWFLDRVLIPGGAMIAAAGVGRMSWLLVAIGAAVACSPVFICAGTRWPRLRTSLAVIALGALATSALVIMMVRARQDPWINQGNPSTWTTLADVVARRQYELSPMWPRRAPIWLQITNVIQYLDWQFAFAWGRGIFATPARVLVTFLFIGLGIGGFRAMRRDARALADALAVLAACGTLGVCAYLNLKSGASIGHGFVAPEAHEARERDYFFVLGFWAWGLFAGYGAMAVVRGRNWRAPLALTAAAVPFAGNLASNDRAHRPEASAPREVAVSLLESAPTNAVLFLAGDNDTYPVWYAQAVERLRPDVTPITLPLLPADWYAAEIERRTGLRWDTSRGVTGANWLHEQRAALISAAARAKGRPIAVTTQMTARERSLLGSSWRLHGTLYVSDRPADGALGEPRVDLSGQPLRAGDSVAFGRRKRLPDDVSGYMLGIFDCARLGALSPSDSVARKSLEVSCNLR